MVKFAHTRPRACVYKIFFVPLPRKSSNMSNSQQFIGRLSRLGRKVLPSTASLWLYGSRARQTAHEGSDWDLLILLDEDKPKSTDFAQYAYPFTLMASAEDQMVIPQIYTKKQWRQMQFTPFVKNVEHDKIVLV